ncbi:hypothetical protein LTR95_006777 [Oleoguttula sp. CCFEE 5521]
MVFVWFTLHLLMALRGTPPKPPPVPTGFQSKSTPNLPTLRSLQDPSTDTSPRPDYPPTTSPEIVTSPSEATSLDSFTLDPPSPLSSALPSEASTSASESDSDDDDTEPPSSLPPRSLYTHPSRSHSFLPNHFAPPFYNRPPTPLPPSPSLTSLLRPPYKLPSRPSTPEISSDEASSHPAAPTTGTATPLPRATPKIPTYEYYGFTLYLSSSLAFMVYLLWAYLPSPFLRSLGITYYPNRWWALAVPAWSVVFVLWIYVALAGYNTGYLTLPLSSVACLVDEAANVAVVDRQGNLIRDERPSWEAATHTTGSSARARSGVRGAAAMPLRPPPSPRRGTGKNGGQITPKARSRQSSPAGYGLEPGLDWKTLWNEGTDAVMDIPIGGVCEILYGGMIEPQWA